MELGVVIENFIAKRLSVKSRLLEGYLYFSRTNPEPYFELFDQEVEKYRQIVRIINHTFRPLAYISLSTLYELLAHRNPTEAYLITEYDLAYSSALATASILYLNDNKKLTGIKKQRLAFFHAACSVFFKQDPKGGPLYRYRATLDKTGNVFTNWSTRIWFITSTHIEYYSLRLWNTVGPEKSFKGKIPLYSIIQLNQLNTEDRPGFLCLRISTPNRIFKISTQPDNRPELESFRYAIDLAVKWFKYLAYCCEYIVIQPEGIPDDLWSELVVASKLKYYTQPNLDTDHI